MRTATPHRDRVPQPGRASVHQRHAAPQRRSWLANLDANPNFTFRLKRAVQADLPATARIIEEEEERRTVLAGVARVWKRDDVETMVARSPLIEVLLQPVPSLPIGVADGGT